MGCWFPQKSKSSLWEQGLTPTCLATHTGGLCASPRANPPPWGAVPLSGVSPSSRLSLGAVCWAASCSGIRQPGEPWPG